MINYYDPIADAYCSARELGKAEVLANGSQLIKVQDIESGAIIWIPDAWILS